MEKSGLISTEEGKASEKQHQVNVDLFFDQKRIVHKEFVPPGQTVNAAFYVEVLKILRENVRRKRPHIGGTTHGCSTMTMRQPMLPS